MVHLFISTRYLNINGIASALLHVKWISNLLFQIRIIEMKVYLNVINKIILERYKANNRGTSWKNITIRISAKSRSRLDNKFITRYDFRNSFSDLRNVSMIMNLFRNRAGWQSSVYYRRLGWKVEAIFSGTILFLFTA